MNQNSLFLALIVVLAQFQICWARRAVMLRIEIRSALRCLIASTCDLMLLEQRSSFLVAISLRRLSIKLLGFVFAVAIERWEFELGCS
jgi:hypothetical protein